MRKIWNLENTPSLSTRDIQQKNVRMKKRSNCQQQVTAAVYIDIYWPTVSAACGLM